MDIFGVGSFLLSWPTLNIVANTGRSRQALGVHVERQRDGIQLLGTIRQQVILRCNLHSRKPEGLQTRIWTALT